MAQYYKRLLLPSSMISTLVLAHRLADFLFFLILATNVSGGSVPKPMPANEWIVTPPMLQAAIPVGHRFLYW